MVIHILKDGTVHHSISHLLRESENGQIYAILKKIKEEKDDIRRIKKG